MKKWLTIALIILVIIVIIIITQLEIRKMKRKQENAFIISYDEANKLLDLGKGRTVVISRDDNLEIAGLSKQQVYYHPSSLLKANLEKFSLLKNTMQLSTLSGLLSIMDIYKTSTTLPSTDTKYSVYANFMGLAIECADFMLIKVIK